MKIQKATHTKTDYTTWNANEFKAFHAEVRRRAKTQEDIEPALVKTLAERVMRDCSLLDPETLLLGELCRQHLLNESHFEGVNWDDFNALEKGRLQFNGLPGPILDKARQDLNVVIASAHASRENGYSSTAFDAVLIVAFLSILLALLASSS